MRGKKISVTWNDEVVPLTLVYLDRSDAGACTVSYQTVCKRLSQGWSVETALLTPPTRRGRKTEVTNVEST